MSIRTSLVLSYLALVVLLTLGMLAGADWVGRQLRRQNMTFAGEGVQNITRANLKISEEVLRKYGEFAVEDTAGTIARELAAILATKKSLDHAAIRRDPQLRRVAVQNIMTPEGVAGYTDLVDLHGVAILHPNRQVEGKSFALWKEQFPEMWRLVEQALSQPHVSGYYSFLDTDNRTRQKFMSLVRVPGFPFIVAAAVNIDRYFLPAQEQITSAATQVGTQADQAIGKFANHMDRVAKIAGLVIGTAVALIGLCSGSYLPPISPGRCRRCKRASRNSAGAISRWRCRKRAPGKWWTWPTPLTTWARS